MLGSSSIQQQASVFSPMRNSQLGDGNEWNKKMCKEKQQEKRNSSSSSNTEASY